MALQLEGAATAVVTVDLRCRECGNELEATSRTGGVGAPWRPAGQRATVRELPEEIVGAVLHAAQGGGVRPARDEGGVKYFTEKGGRMARMKDTEFNIKIVSSHLKDEDVTAICRWLEARVASEFTSHPKTIIHYVEATAKPATNGEPMPGEDGEKP